MASTDRKVGVSGGGRARRWQMLALVGGVGLLAALPTLSLAQAQGEARIQTKAETVQPRADDAGGVPPAVTPQQLAALQERYYRIRETVAARVDNSPASPAGAPDSDVPETDVQAETEFHGSPSLLLVARQVTNTVVPVAPSFKSTLGEPAVANIGEQAFYTGNTFASFSTNDGATWNDRAFPAPAIAGETMCCDQDVEVDQGRNRVFWSLLYLNAAATHGTVTIAVLPSPSAAPACLYDFNLGANIVPDYPHIGLSNDFLYLSTNNIDTQGTASALDDVWANSEMRRISLDAMVDCGVISINVFTLGPPTFTSQRVIVPVEGATDHMFWGMLDNSTTFRLFQWPETTTVVSQFTRVIAGSGFADPDCRGGTNNTDWINPGTSVSITGFRMRGWTGQPPGGGGRGTVGFLWNVGADASHTQGHMHAAVFDATTKTLLMQPHLFNNSFCLMYADAGVTERGHPAIVFGRGGRAGGGGPAIGVMVNLADDFVAPGTWGGSAFIATGTHNPAAGSRWGDYLTIQQHEPCDLFMVASGYAFSGGTGAANVVHRYAQFGRGRDRPCWDFWHLEP